MKKVRAHKRFGLNPALLIIVFLAVLCGAYILVRFLGMLSQTIETVAVSKMTAYESFSGTGWMVRDEDVILSQESENVKHLVSNGDKVGIGTVLAEVYSNESAMNAAKQLDVLDSSISLLQTAKQSTGNYSDAAKVDQMISNQLRSLSALIEDGVCTQLSDYSQELRELSLRRNATTLDAEHLEGEIEALTAQRDALALRIEQQTTEISSGASGYFSEVVDGYEDILTYDKLVGLDAESFEKLVQTKPKESKNTFGKVIKGFSWYFALTVPTEEAAQLYTGQSVTLRFSQLSRDIPAEVDFINITEEEKALVAFRSSYISNEVFANRMLSADIILHSHVGLKVPTSAVYLTESSDGSQTLGVYILTGTTSRFKEITPIYQGENYYIVAQEYTDKALVPGDKVITRGLNLADGKALK